MRVKNEKEAWGLADRLFPTDYELDHKRSEASGYPVYLSTVEGENAWISDLGDRLELNYTDGTSENIWYGEEAAKPVTVLDILASLNKSLQVCIHQLTNSLSWKTEVHTVDYYLQRQNCLEGEDLDVYKELLAKPVKEVTVEHLMTIITVVIMVD